MESQPKSRQIESNGFHRKWVKIDKAGGWEEINRNIDRDRPTFLTLSREDNANDFPSLRKGDSKSSC